MTVLKVDIADSPSASASKMVNQIIGYWRAKGNDQASLAARAGISPESLSRLKRDGGCRLSTALSLARAAGLSRLELLDAGDRQSAAAVAAKTLNAGRRDEISPTSLLDILSGRRPGASHRAHIFGFFEELPIELVHDIVLDEDLEFSGLESLARSMGAEGETVDWIQEMAGHGLA